MSKNVNHLQHIKSNVVVNGQPKLPSGNVLAEGELAINYASGYETISLINSDNETVRFSSDDYYTKLKLGDWFSDENSANTITNIIEENERIVSSSLNDLEDRKAEKTELQSEFNTLNDKINDNILSINRKVEQSDFDSYKTSATASINNKVNNSTFTAYTSSTASELSEINNSIEEMELTLVSAINDIESRIADKITIAALSEEIRALTERVKALEDKTA